MFRVYSGPPGDEPISPLEKGRRPYKEFASLDEAIGFAQHLKTTGRSVLLLEGDDGTRLDHGTLAKELHRRDAEQGHGA